MQVIPVWWRIIFPFGIMYTERALKQIRSILTFIETKYSMLSE